MAFGRLEVGCIGILVDRILPYVFSFCTTCTLSAVGYFILVSLQRDRVAQSSRGYPPVLVLYQTRNVAEILKFKLQQTIDIDITIKAPFRSK